MHWSNVLPQRWTCAMLCYAGCPSHNSKTPVQLLDWPCMGQSSNVVLRLACRSDHVYLLQVELMGPLYRAKGEWGIVSIFNLSHITQNSPENFNFNLLTYLLTYSVASDYSTKEKAGCRTPLVSTTLGYYMERQSAQWRRTKSYGTTKNGPHHQGKKIEMAGTCVAHGRWQDTKASHTMANGLMHHKSRKAEIELDWHRNSRFEVSWHGMGRRRTSSSRQRRLVWTCDPMCLWHGLN